jgi:hypothetical protein
MAVAPAGISVMDTARAVADAVLYEGYLLYPYRRSSGKNQVRWQFGVLLPPGWAHAHGLDDTSVAGSAESWWQQTECLLAGGPDAEVTVCVRFLQVQRRAVAELRPDGSYYPGTQVTVGRQPKLSFDEAVAREFTTRVRVASLLAGEHRLPLCAPGGTDASPLTASGVPVGRLTRQRLPVDGVAVLSAQACPGQPGLVKLRIRVENTGELAATAPRDEALRVSLLACHVLLAASGGSFVSLLDPPPAAQRAARGCVNVHTFPVLAGQPGERAVMLSSPIILYDHPQIAPESPGDLHDATEIDEILSLRALTLTDAEKREARATDERAAAILDRVETMPPEVMSRLHGAVRSLRPLADSVLVAGVRLAEGSRVRLRPRASGTDPQDMFLTGRTARVEAVLTDVDGARQLAVTVDDDPGADLNRWYGRYRYFSPDEVEPLAGGGNTP